MKKNQARLRDRLTRLGFAKENQIRLYGEIFDVISDPIVVGYALVFVDAVERKSGRLRRVRIPLAIVNKARSEDPAA